MPPVQTSPMVLGVNAVEVLGLSGLDQELRRVEPMLLAAVTAGDPFLDQVATHLIKAGGKRLRPMLALAAATRGERRATEADLLGSVSVELVHLASLYHDDVIDEATIRRGTESVNSRFGNLMAIVGGDYLLARSAEIAASLGTEIAGLLATTLGLLCRGQVSEVKTAFSVGRTFEQYLEAIEGKTAALMATSCRVGALTGGAPRTEVEALTEFGRNFGIVFQLRDDVLDVVGTNGELGKPPGQDLAEGVYTLPVLHAPRPAARALRAGQGSGNGRRLERHRRHRGHGSPVRGPGRCRPGGGLIAGAGQCPASPERDPAR
jgi:heptaprenyl diphosphate synthase